MEPTIPQNKVSKRRAALFRRLSTAASKQRPDVRRQLASGDLFIVKRLHHDNGR
jgi:hypothetical protein